MVLLGDTFIVHLVTPSYKTLDLVLSKEFCDIDNNVKKQRAEASLQEFLASYHMCTETKRLPAGCPVWTENTDVQSSS